MKINNINDFAKYFGCGDVNNLVHDVYKYTECGAWINWDKSGFTIGSIVEGSDAEFSESFEFPVESLDVDNWFNELDRLTEEVWIEANGEYEF